MTADPPKFITAEMPDGSTIFAAIDTRARFVEPKVAERKFGAFLTPFPSLLEAKAALVAAGGKCVLEEKRR